MADQNGVVDQNSEDAVNAAAAKEQADAAAAAVVTKEEPSASAVKATDKPAEQKQAPQFDAQKSFTELQVAHKELLKGFTQTAQERAELRKHLEGLQAQQKQTLELLAKATEAPFDTEKFQREWQEKGPQALDSFLSQRDTKLEEKIRSTYDKTISELQNQALASDTQYQVLVMRSDEVKFPNFDDLYPKMLEIAKAENCPVVMKDRPVREILSELYSHAKAQSGEQAVQIAATEAKKRAEAEAAKESKTTVAEGGKRGSVTDVDAQKMPLGDLEKLVMAQFGVADRG